MVGIIQTEIMVYVMPYNLVDWQEYLEGILVPTTLHGTIYCPTVIPIFTTLRISNFIIQFISFQKKKLLFCWLPIPTAQFMSTAVSNPNPVRSSLAEEYLTAGSGFATDA
jgi:hypothetical protein